MFTLAEQIRDLSGQALTARRVARALHVPLHHAEHVLHGLAAHGELVEGGVPGGPPVYWPAAEEEETTRPWHPSSG